MQRVLEILFGIDRSSWTEGGRWTLDWIALPGGDRMLLLLAAIAVIGGLLALVYRWDTRQTGQFTRWSLFGIRALLLLLAVMMLLEPVLVLSKDEKLPSHLVVLVDNSPSMELRDAWKDEVAGAEVASQLAIPNGVAGLREKTRLDLARLVLSPEMLKTLSQDGKRISMSTPTPIDCGTTLPTSQPRPRSLRPANRPRSGRPCGKLNSPTTGSRSRACCSSPTGGPPPASPPNRSAPIWRPNRCRSRR